MSMSVRRSPKRDGGRVTGGGGGGERLVCVGAYSSSSLSLFSSRSMLHCVGRISS